MLAFATQIFGPTGVIPTLRGRKSEKVRKKCGQNERKFQNLLEVLNWHGNSSVGEFRGENEIHELFIPFDSLFPLNEHRDFYCQM